MTFLNQNLTAAQWLAAQHQKLPTVRVRSCYFGDDVVTDESESALSERPNRTMGVPPMLATRPVELPQNRLL